MRCERERPVEEFALCAAKGYQSYCRSCKREWAFVARYNLTTDEVEQMAWRQGGRCAICARMPDGGPRALVVDHDHVTGSVRGLLCHPCNLAIGQMQDDEDRLLAACAYLRRHRAGV